MLPEDIDDLFRQQLDGHATPPAPDLWARLQLPTADTDPVDTTFQDGLRGHATPPRRELWERLEDEHLRPQPRRRRAAAWWQLSAAAVLLLALLVGGGILWHDSYQHVAGNGLARVHSSDISHTTNELLTSNAANEPASQPQEVAAATPLAAEAAEKKQVFYAGQATAARPATSGTSIAAATPPRRAASAARVASSYHHQQPDAAAGVLATNEGRQPSADQSLVAPVMPTATLAEVATTTSLAAAPEIIEVEVRRGAAPTRPAAPAVATVAEPSPTRRRGLRLGSLLRQADHLVHGEPVNLAEATDLPETMTVQARLGGRLVSKTIQL